MVSVTRLTVAILAQNNAIRRSRPIPCRCLIASRAASFSPREPAATVQGMHSTLRSKPAAHDLFLSASDAYNTAADLSNSTSRYNDNQTLFRPPRRVKANGSSDPWGTST
jgi:hypothetical protein